MNLSIIIPAWNEASKIEADILENSRFLEGNSIPGEIILVDDGSADGTAKIAKQVQIASTITLEVITYSPHRGKGFAVRKGILASKGEIVMFMDSGLNVPLKFINTGLKLLKEDRYSIIMGSRHLKESIILKNLVWFRQITSLLFRKFIKIYLGLPHCLTDTQCGFKLYKGDIARKLFAECKSDGFLFDIEIILLALKRDIQIVELPIEWTCDRDSRLSLFNTLFPLLKELKRLNKKFNT